MIPRQPTSLETALAGELLQLLLTIDALPEDQLELETAVRLQEDIGAMVRGLSAEDRELFLRSAVSLADDADATGRGGHEIRRALADLGLVGSA